MALASFYLRAGIQILCFLVVFYAMQAVNFEKFLKPGHTQQAQVLYWVVVLAVSYLLAGFVTSFLYQH